MEQLFEEANFTIRYERGNFNSGYCILDERRVAVINKFLDMEGRINVLIEILPSLNVKEEELSTEMQKWYKTVQNANPGNNSVQSEIEA